MRFTVTRIWITPSTLHLRLMVVGKGDRWVRFREVHVPLNEIPFEDLRNLLDRDQVFSEDRTPDPTLF